MSKVDQLSDSIQFVLNTNIQNKIQRYDKVYNVIVKYIWELDWSILGIGALGKGQLQIKNANNEMVFTEIGKTEWFNTFKVKGLEYNRKQLIKIAGGECCDCGYKKNISALEFHLFANH